jgi:hypothetical protein
MTALLESVTTPTIDPVWTCADRSGAENRTSEQSTTQLNDLMCLSSLIYKLK